MAKMPDSFPPEMLDQLLEARSQSTYNSGQVIHSPDKARYLLRLLLKVTGVTTGNIVTLSEIKQEFSVYCQTKDASRTITLNNKGINNEEYAGLSVMVSEWDMPEGQRATLFLRANALAQHVNTLFDLVEYFIEVEDTNQIKQRISIHSDVVYVGY